jgi:hypothetical protein
VLYVFLVLAHDRPRIVHVGVTPHPTAGWTTEQLREAFPWGTTTRFLLRDSHRIFDQEFVEQVEALGIWQVLSAPPSPWQRAYVEPVIGIIRRECLNHVIVLASRICVAGSGCSSNTTIGAVRICRSAKTLQNRGRFRAATRDV